MKTNMLVLLMLAVVSCGKDSLTAPTDEGPTTSLSPTSLGVMTSQVTEQEVGEVLCYYTEPVTWTDKRQVNYCLKAGGSWYSGFCAFDFPGYKGKSRPALKLHVPFSPTGCRK